MASGFGVDPTLNSEGTLALSGQTAEDTRRVWGAMYSDGILRGCAVTPNSSAMSYTVAPGAVVIPYSSGQVIPAPCYGGTITVPAAPATGSRKDIIWAKQNFPSDGNSNVVVGYGTTLPARAVMLDTFTVNAGQTNTAAALRTTDRRYAVPLSGGTGVIHQFIDTYSGTNLNQSLARQGHKTITLATDRLIRMSVSATLYAKGAVGFDNSKYCEWYFLFTVDGQDKIKYVTPGLSASWATYNFEYYVNVPAGSHTFSMARARNAGPGEAATFHGIDPHGHGRQGMVFTVEDIGPVV